MANYTFAIVSFLWSEMADSNRRPRRPERRTLAI